MKVSISSPAKINLHLKILDKNSDGYHNLDTSFQFIDLYDFMTFEQAKDGILIDTNNSLLNAKENTIYKAAVSLQELSKKNFGVKITIKKNIPIGAGLGGGHDEREQTLNQLLVEMDGFEGNDGVIVIAATNRPDVLDPALLRPGRFDRQVVVDLPDIRGREAILKVHMRKVPLDSDVDPLVLARGTPGFSGADLANLINEAALFAARYSDKKIDQTHLDLAKDKIMMGAERKSMILSEEQKRITAYHEAGHAIVGRLCPTHDPVYKVTIIPRGRALGVTMFLPEEDTYMQSKEYLLGRIATLFGGRIAENIINGDQGITTGASNDIEVATGIATNMVTKWGFSDALGTIKFGEDEGSPFLGRSASSPAQFRSEETSKLIDSEVKLIIDTCYERAENLLKTNLDKLNVMADALLKYETIDEPQIDDIMAGAEPREPKGWSDDEPTPKSNKKTSIKGAAEEL